MRRYRKYAPEPRSRMNMLEYQALAQRTSAQDHDRVDNGVLGLIGETGEIVDVYKKWKYQSIPGTPAPDKKFTEELGDVLWYIAELASGRGWTMLQMLEDDFEKYDEAAWKEGCKGPDRMRKIITSMSARANDICTYVSECDFSRAKCHIRRLMQAAAMLAMMCNSTLQDVAYENIKKLKRRYPDGFDAKISMNRYV